MNISIATDSSRSIATSSSTGSSSSAAGGSNIQHHQQPVVPYNVPVEQGLDAFRPLHVKGRTERQVILAREFPAGAALPNATLTCRVAQGEERPLSGELSKSGNYFRAMVDGNSYLFSRSSKQTSQGGHIYVPLGKGLAGAGTSSSALPPATCLANRDQMMELVAEHFVGKQSNMQKEVLHWDSFANKMESKTVEQVMRVVDADLSAWVSSDFSHEKFSVLLTRTMDVLKTLQRDFRDEFQSAKNAIRDVYPMHYIINPDAPDAPNPPIRSEEPLATFATHMLQAVSDFYPPPRKLSDPNTGTFTGELTRFMSVALLIKDYGARLEMEPGKAGKHQTQMYDYFSSSTRRNESNLPLNQSFLFNVRQHRANTIRATASTSLSANTRFNLNTGMPSNNSQINQFVVSHQINLSTSNHDNEIAQASTSSSVILPQFSSVVNLDTTSQLNTHGEMTSLSQISGTTTTIDDCISLVSPGSPPPEYVPRDNIEQNNTEERNALLSGDEDLSVLQNAKTFNWQDFPADAKTTQKAPDRQCANKVNILLNQLGNERYDVIGVLKDCKSFLDDREMATLESRGLRDKLLTGMLDKLSQKGISDDEGAKLGRLIRRYTAPTSVSSSGVLDRLRNRGQAHTPRAWEGRITSKDFDPLEMMSDRARLHVLTKAMTLRLGHQGHTEVLGALKSWLDVLRKDVDPQAAKIYACAMSSLANIAHDNKPHLQMNKSTESELKDIIKVELSKLNGLIKRNNNERFAHLKELREAQRDVASTALKKIMTQEEYTSVD